MRPQRQHYAASFRQDPLKLSPPYSIAPRSRLTLAGPACSVRSSCNVAKLKRTVSDE